MIDKWHARFLELAALVATWSKDPSTKVGAVLVDDDRKVVGLGYNGFPRGVVDDPEHYANREIKYKKVVHAEVNAVLNAVKATAGATLYCTFFPCPQCAALVIQAGIRRVVSARSASDQRWKEEHAIAQAMFVQAGIIVIYNESKES